MSPDSNRRSSHAQAAILAATVDTLRADGLSGLTIEGVAARAGVGKQTIYRWWPSKGALAIDALLAAAEPAITFPDTDDIAADIADVLGQVSSLLAEADLGPHFVACLMQCASDPDLAERFSSRVFGPVRATYRDRLERAQNHEQLRTDVDLDVALDMAFGALWFRAATRPASLSPEFGQQVAQLLVTGAGIIRRPPTRRRPDGRRDRAGLARDGG